MWISILVKLTLLAIILYLLIKYGVLHVTTMNNYKYNRSGNQINMTYKKLHGSQFAHFIFPKGVTATLNIDVTIEQGTLKVEWRDGRKLLYEKTFHESGQASFTFTSKFPLHYVKVTGSKAKGRFRLDVG